MFIVHYVPHRVMSRGADPVTFVASNLNKAKLEIQERLGVDLEFTPAMILSTFVGDDGQEYCSGSYDESGEKWRAQGPNHSTITIKPIEFVS